MIGAAFIGAIAASRLVVAGRWLDIINRSGGGNIASGGWSGYTCRCTIPSSAVPNASKFRLTLSAVGVAAPGITLGAAYVGIGAASGNPYAFAGAPTQVLWGGASGRIIAENTEVVSDETDVLLDDTGSLVIALYFSSTTSLRSDTPSAVAGETYHYKFGNDAATVSATGYTLTSSGTYSFRRVEVFS